MVEVYISNNKLLFDQLYAQKEQIEQALGFNLDWRRLTDTKKASRILYSIPELNFDNHSNYQQLMNEIIDKVMQMKKVFSKYI